tara:strand:- start:335 stop:1453 length:1119 start_codon:yes stop_codon:yes gene_type:complete
LPSANILRESSINRSSRVKQIESIFDLDEAGKSKFELNVNLDLPDDWNVGLIVGPSGSGKTTVARELFGDHIITNYEWDNTKSIIDCFPMLSVKELSKILSSVGFSSPPAWLRPFNVLSNGEQFRVTLARAIAESKELFVVDEFTSVVDRTVAQIGSHAVAKTIRKTDKKFIAVSCHYDIIDWLEPDWIYEPHKNRLSRRSVQRPKIELEVYRTTPKTWDIFKNHHYLNTEINNSAIIFVGCINQIPAVFTAVMPMPGGITRWREHRTVCLPDFQGIGIGNVMSEYVASLFKDNPKGRHYCSITSHPAMIYYRAKSKNWKMIRAPSRSGIRNDTNIPAFNATSAHNRPTATFIYANKSNIKDARRFDLNYGI